MKESQCIQVSSFAYLHSVVVDDRLYIQGGPRKSEPVLVSKQIVPMLVFCHI